MDTSYVFALLIVATIIFLCIYPIIRRMKKRDKELPQKPNLDSGHVTSGWKIDKILILIGSITLISALLMDTSIQMESGLRINNLGLMNDKQNYLIISGIFLFIGVFLNFSSRNKKDKNIMPTTLPDDDTKTCPYCAETIKSASTICRFCDREQGIK